MQLVSRGKAGNKFFLELQSSPSFVVDSMPARPLPVNVGHSRQFFVSISYDFSLSGSSAHQNFNQNGEGGANSKVPPSPKPRTANPTPTRGYGADGTTAAPPAGEDPRDNKELPENKYAVAALAAVVPLCPASKGEMLGEAHIRDPLRRTDEPWNLGYGNIPCASKFM